MVRPVPALLLALLGSVPAAAQPKSTPDQWRLHEVNFADNPALKLPGADIGSLGRLGVGMFGIRTEPLRQPAVTVREIDAPRQRRAGVGISLKF
jgi:hypothetical protein